MADERARCAPGQWVLGWGLDYNVFGDDGIRGSLIDDAVGGAPAFVAFMDFHTHLATPRALELAGVDGPRAFTENAEVVCVDGAPTGELRESAADLVLEVIPELTAAERYGLYADTLRRFAAVGITAAHMMDGDLSSLDLLRELEANGDLATRLVLPFWIKPEMDPEEWEQFIPHRAAAGRRWKGGVAKFFIDGVIDAGTGWLYEPDSEGEGTLPFWPDPAVYRRAVARFAGEGFQCATHATGRPRRARGARRLPRRRRGARRAPPDRAHRDAAAVRPAAVRGRGRGRLDAGAAHDGVPARPRRELVAAARR